MVRSSAFRASCQVSHLGLQQLSAGDASIQTLPTEDADFDFRHVQPTRVLGRVVKLHPAQELYRRALAQDVDGLPEVGVQVIQHQVDATCLGIRIGQQATDEGNEVNLAPLRRDFDDSLTRLGFDRHEQVGRAVSDALVVLLGRAVRNHRQWVTAVGDELQTFSSMQITGSAGDSGRA
jgi:hypothetical protein